MTALEEIDARARQILEGNDRGGYTVPTEGLYPFQWNWDSAFAALGFAAFDVGRAWDELDTLLSGQWDNGMVPHILFHRPSDGYFPGPEVWGCPGPIPSSGITQPPVATTFARQIFDIAPEHSRDRLARVFAPLKAWHRWFMTYRLDRGAVFVTHPWEAGRDNAPEWDHAMARIDPVGVGPYERRDTAHVDASMRPTKYDYDRYIWLVQNGRAVGWAEDEIQRRNPFRVADPTMTFILLRANRDLAAIAEVLGEDAAEIESWTAILEDGARSLWNPDLQGYDARDVIDGTWGGALSNASFLCWYAGVGNDAMLAHLDAILAKTRFGVPSHDPDSPNFDGLRYWRGPVWAIMNTMIGIGLAEAGHTGRADTLRAQTERLIADYGFAEYFDPRTGQPAGGKDFTWTAAVWLSWVRGKHWRAD